MPISGARWPKIQSMATRNSAGARTHTCQHQMSWKSGERTCYQFLLWHQYECEGLQSDSEECLVSLWQVKLSREHFCQLVRAYKSLHHNSYFPSSSPPFPAHLHPYPPIFHPSIHSRFTGALVVTLRTCYGALQIVVLLLLLPFHFPLPLLTHFNTPLRFSVPSPSIPVLSFPIFLPFPVSLSP